MTGRMVGRWADDLTPPPDPVVDEQLVTLGAEAARFRRSLLVWAAVIIFGALLWHVVAPRISVSEATGAWIGIAVFFGVIVIIIEVASRRARSLAAPPAVSTWPPRPSSWASPSFVEMPSPGPDAVALDPMKAFSNRVMLLHDEDIAYATGQGIAAMDSVLPGLSSRELDEADVLRLASQYLAEGPHGARLAALVFAGYIGAPREAVR